MPTTHLFLGDSIALMGAATGLRSIEGKLLKADACVCDPPYNISLDGDTGKTWDTFEDNRSFTTAADDAAKFAEFTKLWARAARTEILKPGAHVLAFSADRTIDLVGRGLRESGLDIVRILFWLYSSGQVKNPNDTRPGCEPIFVGRVPTDQTLNKLFKDTGRGQLHAQTWKEEDGKHPTNMLISEEAVALDEDLTRLVVESKASFFVPKPTPKDRDWGCDDLPMTKKDNRLSHMSSNYTGKVVKDVMAQNYHTTVKPIEIMRRLIRLVSRPGHTILDPFMGSGTCGIAAIQEGRNYIGVEREPDFFVIAATRVASALREAGNEAGADQLLAQREAVRAEHGLTVADTQPTAA